MCGRIRKSLPDQETSEAALSGSTPDYFSATGQLWGNPVYNWEKLQQLDFQWWVQRFQAMLDYIDIIRIDHFRGFQAYWAVRRGNHCYEWSGLKRLEKLCFFSSEVSKLPVLAEDLGVITPEVAARPFEFPGMKILHFAFGSDPGNLICPSITQRVVTLAPR